MTLRPLSGRSAPFLLAVLAAALSGPPEAWPGPIRSPHSMEACIDCHRNPALLESNPEGIPTIIVPEGTDPHRVLANSCLQCHPKGVPPYWMIVFPKKGAPTAAVAAQSAPVEAIPPSSSNPHDQEECGECHQKKVSFERPTGEEKLLVDNTGDINDFCLRCHDDMVERHYPRGNLPLGSTNCLTCHKVHHATRIPPLLRDDYYVFIREIRDFNPHGGAPGCLVCHPSKPLAGEPAELIYGPGEANKLCVRCHQGPPHHVVDRPSSKGTWKLEFLHYPLQDGKIGCLTCHKPHGGEVGTEGAPTYSLRGEPYQKMTDFCFKCHEEKSWGTLNAHDHLTNTGEIKTVGCLFCHVKIPDLAGNPSLLPDDFNGTYTETCTQCHDPFPHPEVNHLVIPSRDMETTISAYSEKRAVALPLDFDGRLTCVTCHNPHEKGLLTGPEAVGADESQRLRLTTFNEICTPCHGRR